MDRRYMVRTLRPVGSFEERVFEEDKKNKTKKLVFIKKSYKVRDDGSIQELDVDQFSGMPFMQNPNGFITNDIMMFEECQSDSVARAIINRLKILHPESVDQKLSVDQIMNMVVPSNYGSPAEFVSAHKMMAEKAYRMYEADYNARQEALAAQAARVVASEVSDLSKSVPNPE